MNSKKCRNRQNAIWLLVLLFPILASAQVNRIRGFVYEQANQNPIPFASVVLKDTKFGVNSNTDGYFQINNIPDGTYVLEISFVGFSTIRKQVSVSGGRILTEKFYMEEETTMLEDVVINVERQEMKTKVMTSVVSLSPKKIVQFSVGGDADLIRAVQVIPGVITTGDQGGQIFIRGGAPIQNLTLLDGMILYNPFHSIGFFSVFDTDILQSADVYTGGFQAEYGSRSSSVMDIKTRDGNRKRFAGKVQASSYSSKVLLETPLGKKNENGLAPMSLLVSGKASYLDRVAPILYPYAETDFGGLPFSFADLYGKWALVADNGSKINVYGFNFNDNVQLSPTQGINWNSAGYGAYFKVIPGGSAVIMEGNFNNSSYFIESTELEGRPRRSRIGSFNGGLDFTYLLRENDELKYGLQIIGYNTDYLFTNELGFSGNQAGNSSELGSYMKYKVATGRFLIEPGIRLQYYGSHGELSVEPRLGLKYSYNDRLRLKFSGGWYSQNLVAANSDRDVVNLFYGFLNGPENIPDEFRGEPITGRIQKARHAVLGFEYDLGNKMDINVEGYVKDFNQMTNINRNKLFENIEAYADQPEIFRRDFIIEKGLAYGVDFLIKYNEKRWNIFAGYSISRVNRDDGIMVYFPHFDRRHNTNIVGTVYLDKQKNWEANVRWNYGSGFPFTPTVGYFAEQNFLDQFGRPAINYDYTTGNGEPGVIYGQLNSARLPQYHRFDITIRRIWKMARNGELDLSFGATNLYNRQNIFYFDRANFRRVDQLPIMPTASLSYAF
jgi:hypothetical protein